MLTELFPLVNILYLTFLCVPFVKTVALAPIVGEVSHSALLPVLFPTVIFATLIEYLLQAPKKWKATARGKKVIYEGLDFAGTLVIKIEK